MNSNENAESPRRDLSIPILSAYLSMLPIVVPLVGAMIAAHLLIWGIGNLSHGLNRMMQLGSLIPVLVIGIPMHEFIHALTWVLAGGIEFREIEFGFDWKGLAPYAHAKVPMKARAYRIGAVMPAVILGALPYLIGITTGRGWFTWLGVIYAFTAGGDLLVLWLILNVEGDARVEDHPTRAGCYVYE